MKSIALIFLLISFTSCTSKKTTDFGLDGTWNLVEVKCDDGDYTEAGLKLREFYQSPTNTRQIQINGDQTLTTIISKENKKDKTKLCHIEITSNIIWAQNKYTTYKSDIKKTSPLDKSCQGTRSTNLKSMGHYSLEDEQLKLSRKGAVERLNPKAPSLFCQSGPLSMVYRK